MSIQNRNNNNRIDNNQLCRQFYGIKAHSQNSMIPVKTLNPMSKATHLFRIYYVTFVNQRSIVNYSDIKADYFHVPQGRKSDILSFETAYSNLLMGQGYPPAVVKKMIDNCASITDNGYFGQKVFGGRLWYMQTNTIPNTPPTAIFVERLN